MSDILSGGAIDETTSGPIPASQDNRSLDIIAEAAAKQEREAIGGSQNPPTVEPPPPIPPPTEVAPPPLPDIDVPQLGIDFGSAAEATREIARQATVDVLKRVTIDGQGPVIEGSAISFNTERRSTASEDFGTGGNANFIQPAFSQGRLEAADFGSRAAMEDRSSANAYAAAEARRDERRMEDPSFNRESPERQRGETRRDFRERQEQLQQERQQMAQAGIVSRRERDGDINELPSGMVPVRLTRADGQKKILALMATELVGVVEGATGNERTVPLPPEDSYYEGGGGTATKQPWDLLPTNVGTPESPSWEIRVQAGTLNSFLPINWDDDFRANNTSLYYAKAIISTNGRSITSVSIDITTSPALPQEPQSFGIDNEVEYLFGLFYEGRTQRIIGDGSITLNPAMWITVSASPPAGAGELPYEIYYRLQ